MTVVNPIMGGGLSGAKLALADAAAADVLAGKKFYAIDKTLKTGTRSSGTIQKVSGSFPALDASSSTKNSYTITLPISPEVVIFYCSSSGGSSGFLYQGAFYGASHYKYLESRADDNFRSLQGSRYGPLRANGKTITFTESVYGKGTVGGEYTLHLFDLGTVYYVAYG